MFSTIVFQTIRNRLDLDKRFKQQIISSASFFTQPDVSVNFAGAFFYGTMEMFLVQLNTVFLASKRKAQQISFFITIPN